MAIRSRRLLAGFAAFFAAGGSADARNCEILYRLTDDVTVSAIQWSTDYSTAPGVFAGSGGTVECTPLPGLPTMAANDQELESRLDLALLGPPPFAGPADLVRCNFESNASPSVPDFAVMTTVAADANFNPILPLPDIAIASISCEPCDDAIEGKACDDSEICTADQCVQGECQATPMPNCPFVPDDVAAGDEFGSAIAISRDFLVVGAPASLNDSSGRVHVFVPSGDGYVEHTQNAPALEVPFRDHDTPTGNLNFGASVDVDQDTIVVGAPFDVVPVGDKQSHGSASVFFWNGSAWTQQDKLVDESGLCSELGTDVAVSGDTIVLGAPGGNCVLVFERSGVDWEFKDKLESGVAGARFGQSVDVSLGTILAGRPGSKTPTGCSSKGAVLIYGRAGTLWTLESTIEEPGGTGGCFGLGVGVDSLTGVAGAKSDGAARTGGGAAYVIERDGSQWGITEQLLAFPEPRSVVGFGASLDISANLIVVGAPGMAAYQFERVPDEQAILRGVTSWLGSRRFTPPPDHLTDEGNFGTAVTIAAGRTAVGAPSEQAGELMDAGAAYTTRFVFCGDSITADVEECDDGDTDWQEGQYCNDECRALMCGDTNDSGRITTTDALFILRTSVGARQCDHSVCNVDGDQIINSIDALRDLRIAIGLNLPLNCPPDGGPPLELPPLPASFRKLVRGSTAG